MPHFAGDPEGRRLTRRRATHLAEAGALARALEVLLKRAAFDVSGCTNLAQGIAHQEAIEIQRAAGRIESRKRFKSKSGQPLLEGRTVSSLCLDECGKSVASQSCCKNETV